MSCSSFHKYRVYQHNHSFLGEQDYITQQYLLWSSQVKPSGRRLNGSVMLWFGWSEGIFLLKFLPMTLQLGHHQRTESNVTDFVLFLWSCHYIKTFVLFYCAVIQFDFLLFAALFGLLFELDRWLGLRWIVGLGFSYFDFRKRLLKFWLGDRKSVV